jgi:hypothetical protein
VGNENEHGKNNQLRWTRRMKVLLGLVLIAANAFAQEPQDGGEPLHYRLTSDPGLSGKGEEGSCMDYAIALSSKLSANGIHGRLIFWPVAYTEAVSHMTNVNLGSAHGGELLATPSEPASLTNSLKICERCRLVIRSPMLLVTALLTLTLAQALMP